MSKIWLGSIFLRDEGGYKIVLKALEHYKKRLRSIASSPELQDNHMFKQVVEQEAMKIYPKIGALITILPQFLENNDHLEKIENNVSLISKALESYKVDIGKAKNSTDVYYAKLVDLSQISENDISLIENAIEKIQKHSWIF